jgi:hypothetical protein
MMYHRIENRQQLPHRRGQRNLGRFAGRAQALVESLDGVIPRVATGAAMYKARRTDARPPQMIRRPRSRPLSRLKRATSTKAG